MSPKPSWAGKGKAKKDKVKRAKSKGGSSSLARAKVAARSLAFVVDRATDVTILGAANAAYAAADHLVDLLQAAR